MWLLYKGKWNQIWVLYERYMKHNVTPINGENEPLAFIEIMFGNCLLETTLGCYPTWPAPTPPNTQLGLLSCPTDCNKTCITQCTNSSSSSSISSTSTSSGPCTDKLWTIYFDRSKAQDVLGVGCVLIDPYNKKHLISSRLGFECMNNVAEYQALMLGLQKAISLNVVMLKVVGDSEKVVQQLHNTIDCLSPHLKCYHQEVWRLISNFQAFNIIDVPSTCNATANALANASSRMSLIMDILTIEILYKPLSRITKIIYACLMMINKYCISWPMLTSSKM